MRGSLRFERTEILVITTRGEAPRLWTVGDKHPEGWLLEPIDSEGERRIFLHDEIFKIYVEGRLKVLGRRDRIESPEEEMRSRRAWESAPLGLRTIADRRFQILRTCIESRSNYCSMAACFDEVPGTVISKMKHLWAEENVKLRKQHGPGPRYDVSALDRHPVDWVPAERTMWNWYKRCGYGAPNLRRLLPRDHLKGDTRSLFDSEMVALMERTIEEQFLKPPPKTALFVYKIFEGKAIELLGDAYIPPIEIPRPRSEERALPDGYVHADVKLEDEGKKRNINQIPSYPTFTRHINKVRADAKTRGLSGNREANIQFGTFSEAEAPPFMLHQVEVDHSFINMWVRDEVTGRIIGRPWITAIRERKTKVILGLHVSFLPPSWMTLSRAVAHAIWPKDLSGFSGVGHGWGYHGVFDWMLTDRGLEFLGDGLRLSGRLIGFEIGNLQGFSPWLKGGLERLFRSLKGQIFSYRDGTSAWRALKHYDGRATTEMTYGELKSELVSWVGVYHHRRHETLHMSPDERWNMEVEVHGSPRGVAEFQDLRRLFCKTESRGIGRNGIEYDGLLFNHANLAELRGRGGVNQWDIMIDPFNLGSIFLQDPMAGVTEDTWLEVPCTRPELAENMTQPQHELHKMLARLSAPGETITEAMLLRAAEGAEAFLQREFNGNAKSGTAARLARYRDDGSFLTPISIDGRTPQLKISRSVDWGQAQFDPVTGRPLDEPTSNAERPSGSKEKSDPAKPANDATSDGQDSTDQPSDCDYESAILQAASMLKML